MVKNQGPPLKKIKLTHKKSVPRTVRSSKAVADWINCNINIDDTNQLLISISEQALHNKDILFKEYKIQPNCPLTLHGQHVLFVNFTGQVRVSKKSCAVEPGVFALCGKGKKTVRILNSSLPALNDLPLLPAISIVKEIKNWQEATGVKAPTYWDRIDYDIVEFFRQSEELVPKNSEACSSLFVPSDYDGCDSSNEWNWPLSDQDFDEAYNGDCSDSELSFES